MIIHKHRSIKRTLRNILISAGILLVIFVAAGVAYVYFSDKDSGDKKPEPADVETKDPLDNPTMPAENAPNGASIQYILSPAKPGENTTVNVHTGPYADCTIVVAYQGVVSKDSGLAPKKSDIHGVVDWTWTIDKTAPAGKWPVKITCVRNKQTAFVQGELEVTK